jgi:hypothetical protein
MKKILFIFLILVMLVGSVYAIEDKFKLSPQKMYTVMNHIEVRYPWDGEICVINQGCSIIWVKNLIENYPTVWLEIVWPDGTSTAGAYPVTNTGQYDWKPDASFWDESVRCKEYRVKVYTNDKKYQGMSGRFRVGQTWGKCP